MPEQNNSRSILITGCSSGIGLCVAKGLKQRGYRVFATVRQEKDIYPLIDMGLESLQLDLDNSDSINLAVDTILSRTNGELYALFNNGAYGQVGAVEDLSRDALRAQFETNLFGWHELTCRVLPVMRQQGYGRIIQNSSILGFVSLPFRGAYNSSKYALEGLTDTMRLELHDTNIFISLIEPGPIESRFRANSYKAFKQHIDKAHSPFQKQYVAVEARLTKEGPVVPFTLSPEAVLKKVIHALESKRPRERYYVTFPTHLFGTLKRLLSTRALDKALRKV